MNDEIHFKTIDNVSFVPDHANRPDDDRRVIGKYFKSETDYVLWDEAK